MSENVVQQTRNTPQRFSIKLLVGVFLISVSLTSTVIFLLVDHLVPENDTNPYTDVFTQRTDGVRVIDPPRAVSDFTLTSHTGDPVSLSDLQGQKTMMFFGYTHCPDVCPMSIMDMQRVRTLLAEDGPELNYLFISVDEDRDAPDRLASFLEMRRVNDFMIALTGEEVTLRQITPDYRLVYQANEAEENGYYTVDHTSSLFLIDEEGRLERIFSFGTEPATIADEILSLG